HDALPILLHFGFCYMVKLLVIDGAFQFIGSWAVVPVKYHVYIYRKFIAEHLLLGIITVIGIKARSSERYFLADMSHMAKVRHYYTPLLKKTNLCRRMSRAVLYFIKSTFIAILVHQIDDRWANIPHRIITC